MSRNKKYFFVLLVLILVSFSCIELTVTQLTAARQGVDSSKNVGDGLRSIPSEIVPELTVNKIADSLDFETQFKLKGLVSLTDMDSTIKVDLKYSTLQNFTGTDIYGALDKAYFQKEVAEKLIKAQQVLTKRFPFYHLKILDAARPLSVQKLLWAKLDLPFVQKINYLSNPIGKGSLHNYGVAVDVTIVNDQNIEMDMGSAYDTFDATLSSQTNTVLLESGKLTYRQFDNRELLRKVMCTAGFYPIASEWWHFNACNFATAQAKYELL